jgi:Ca-activated chloride channel homolog
MPQGARTIRWVFAACTLALAALAQSPPSFRADSTLVLVPVSVTDPGNRYVLGLGREHFHLLEDGVEQAITHFSSEDAPLSVGFVIDASGSMGAKLSISRRAVGQFLKSMNPSDEAFLVEFSDRAEVSLPFTHDMDRIERRVGTLTTGGLTAMLDAIHMAFEEMNKAANPRKALLIISDGGDNHSLYSSSQIEQLVREAGVQIFAVGVFEPFAALGLLTQAERDGPKLLSELAEQTGGRALAAVIDNDGKYRRVEIKLEQPETLPALKARWRLGYYAPNE